MEIYYEGKDITGSVLPRSAVHRDVSHGEADVLEIAFRQAASWHRWDPQIGDKIRIWHNRYDTGTLYVHTIIPESENYRIIATSLPMAANRPAWQGYREYTLTNLLHRGAAECGMDDKLYGAAGSWKYPYLMRENEGWAAFLMRICEAEGIALKAWGGAFRGIEIKYAQDFGTQIGIKIDAGQEGVKYLHQPGKKYKKLTVRTPWAEATATDDGAEEENAKTIGGLPARDAATAARWARGLLLHHNRKADMLEVESTFRADMTAMIRVNVSGGTGADGDWLIDEAEHDFVNDRTRAKLVRVIESVR